MIRSRAHFFSRISRGIACSKCNEVTKVRSHSNHEQFLSVIPQKPECQTQQTVALFHTNRGSLGTPTAAGTKKRRYQDVESVFGQMKRISCAETVKKVNATYVIKVTGVGTFYIDYSQGEGSVGSGDRIPGRPDNFEPDVRITVSKENCLKIFNREIQLATAYMTGKFELEGDVTKVMSMEGILKATRHIKKS